MRRGCLALAIGVAAALGPAAPSSAQTALRVYVGAAKVEPSQPDKATKERMKDAAEAADKARKETEKKLKDQFGKKREQWPAEQQDTLINAEEEAYKAAAAYHYLKLDPKAISDSTEDIKKKLAGKGMLSAQKKHVMQVASAEEADLVVEVVGRRSSKTLPTYLRADNYWVCFSIAAGGKLDAGRLAGIPRNWRKPKWTSQAWKLHSYTAEEPYWKFEAYHSERWSDVADVASQLIDDFVEDHYAALTASAAAP